MAADRSRLAAALAYEEERRRRMMESVPGLVTTPAQPAPRTDFRTNLENLSIGLGEGLTNQLEGIKGIITDPVGTAKGVYEAGRAVVRDPSVIADALRYTAQKATSGSLGAGEVIGEMLGPRKGGPMMQELDVYHGTPHRFPATEANPLGEFDASKIGTGEGAQAYGHGIYYAESPDVAKTYRSSNDPIARKAEMLLQSSDGDVSRAMRYAQKKVEDLEKNRDVKGFFSPVALEQNKGALEYLKQIKSGKTPEIGALYKADLPDEMIDRMLDWDQPLSKQPAAIQEIARKIGIGKAAGRTKAKLQAFIDGTETPETSRVAKGGDLYLALSDYGNESVAGTRALQEAGILGIKYRDAGSRGQGGSGTRNFVVFPGEEKKVRILERK